MNPEVLVGLLALGAPVVQLAAMGFIGYPIARRSPEGMEQFHRSGLVWWIGVLVGIAVIGAVLAPEFLSWTSPSSESFSWLLGLAWCLGGVVGLLAIELVGARLLLGPARSESRRQQDAQFEAALPRFAHSGAPLLLAVLTIAALEELIFRGLGLAFLLQTVGLGGAFAAGICAALFGLSHWYYGLKQVVIKSVQGGMLVAVALGSNWVLAMVAHMAFNAIITWISERNRTGRG